MKRLAGRRGIELTYEARHGKGSHGRLLFGDKLTTKKDPKKEIGPGLPDSMLEQLGLKRDDII